MRLPFSRPCPLQEVPYLLVHVDLADKPAWFRAVNPRGLVPVVQYDVQTVTESRRSLRADGH